MYINVPKLVSPQFTIQEFIVHIAVYIITSDCSFQSNITTNSQQRLNGAGVLHRTAQSTSPGRVLIVVHV